MDYAQARAQIETGDMIAVRDVHGILGWLTRWFTRSPYTHTGIALWLAGGLYMAELNGGRNHLVPLSQLTAFDVYEAPRGLTDIEAAVMGWLRAPIAYGYLAFVLIGLIDWLRLQVFVHWRRILVCSGYCVAIYETAGWPEHSRVISPGGLAKLLTLKLSVEGTE